ncbi:MAG TPA: SRPBCC family protein, partial [Chloroflexia bacterium]|nr:SRPBCC family protein [Chloroflexia bacterium]
MRVAKELVVNAPVSKVYGLWTDFENFPRFMSHVDSVASTGADNYHWKAHFGPRAVEWDARVVGLVPDRSVTWRSTSGAENAGAVNLAAQGNVTLMQVVIEYHPSWFEGLLDTITQEMSRSVEADLEKFKRLAEGVDGEALPSGAAAGRSRDDSSAAQGATSASVGAGNRGAYGPSAARSGDTAGAVPTPAAPTAGSAGADRPVAAAGAPPDAGGTSEPAPAAPPTNLPGGPSSAGSPPAPAGADRPVQAAGTPPAGGGTGQPETAPPPTNLAGEPSAAGSPPAEVSGPSLYSNEAAGFEGYSGSAGESAGTAASQVAGADRPVAAASTPPAAGGTGQPEPAASPSNLAGGPSGAGSPPTPVGADRPVVVSAA